MKIKIYIWYNTSKYSTKEWKDISKDHIVNGKSINQIIFNHRLKLYAKNFKCTKHQLAIIIKKAIDMKNGDTTNFTI